MVSRGRGGDGKLSRYFTKRAQNTLNPTGCNAYPGGSTTLSFLRIIYIEDGHVNYYPLFLLIKLP